MKDIIDIGDAEQWLRAYEGPWCIAEGNDGEGGLIYFCVIRWDDGEVNVVDNNRNRVITRAISKAIKKGMPKKYV